jgi:hypothetical protein
VAKCLHVQKIPTVEEMQSPLPLFVIYTGNQNQNEIDRNTRKSKFVDFLLYVGFLSFPKNYHNFPNLSGPGPSSKKWYESPVFPCETKF